MLQQVVHFAETVAGAEDSQELDLDPRTNEDNRVRPIEETCTFQIDTKEE